jgi:hypothetical protein
MADGWVATPGAAPAVVTDTHVAIVVGDESATAAIDRVSRGPTPASLGALVDRVLAGGSVAEAPAFFLAVRESSVWRAAVRGPIAVRVDQHERVLGETAATWFEVSFALEASFDVEVLVDHAASWLPLAPGPVRVGALRRESGASLSPPSDVPAPEVDESSPDAVDIAVTLAQPVQSPVEPPSLLPPAQPSPPSRYDELFGEFTVAGGVAAAAAAAQHEGEDHGDGVHGSSLPAVETETGFDHSDVAVSAILCEQQHPNPPERGKCWKCAAPIASRSLIRVPRPSLGSLLLDDGREVPIDRTVLLGRNPRAERTDAANLPALISVGPEAAGVSRTHVRIFLDGWQVLIEDLGSSFGTTILATDGSTRRLRPGQPEVVTGDAVLDLGGGSRVRLVGVP